MRSILTITMFVVQVVIGILAFLAFTDLLESWGWLFILRAFAVGVAFLALPFLITPLGIWGAITVWHWPWWQAVGVFVWPLVLQLLVLVVGGAAAAGAGVWSALSGARRRPS